jgi:SAM-dependent methyltransferase
VSISREWQRLFDRFARRLIELRPASVLDVGCGRGALVSLLTNAGIPATGVDPAAPGDNPQILAANAEKLPFDDAAFEWVTLRHVPHHLPNLPAALAECVRVARIGLLIAEPWFDGSYVSQRVAERWDRWWKRRHEANGEVHRPCVSLAELQAALPAGAFDIEAEHYRHEADIAIGEIEELSTPLLTSLPDGHPDQAEYAAIVQEIASRGFSYNGTLIATIRKGN